MVPPINSFSEDIFNFENKIYIKSKISFNIILILHTPHEVYVRQSVFASLTTQKTWGTQYIYIMKM